MSTKPRLSCNSQIEVVLYKINGLSVVLNLLGFTGWSIVLRQNYAELANNDRTVRRSQISYQRS